MSRKFALFVSLVALAWLLVPAPAAAQFDDPVELRFVHLVPDAPPVDVYVDGQVAFQNVAFGEVAAWQTVEEAEVDVAVAAAGDVLENAVFTADDVSLFVNSPDVRLTIIARGSLERDTLAASVIIENYTPTDEARLELFHAFERAPAVDLINGERVLVNSLAYPGTQDDNDGHFTLNVPADTYSDLRLEGDNTDTTLFDLGSVTFEPGTSTFIAAVGPIASPQLIIETTTIPQAAAADTTDTPNDDTPADDVDEDATPTEDDDTATDTPTDDATDADADTDTDDTPPADDTATTDTDDADDAADDSDTATDDDAVAPPPAEPTGPLFISVRVGHMVADAPAVDIYINEVPLNTAASFRDYTPWLLLPAGPLSVALVPDGEPLSAAVFTADDLSVSVEAETQRITLVAVGLLADESISLQSFIEDYSPVEAGQARIGVFHAIPDAPAVDVLLNDQRLVGSLSFPGAAGDNDGHFELMVNAETVDVNVVSSEGLIPLASVEGVVIPDGESLLLTIVVTNEGEIQILQNATPLGDG
jgi:hypothetical protein